MRRRTLEGSNTIQAAGERHRFAEPNSLLSPLCFPHDGAQYDGGQCDGGLCDDGVSAKGVCDGEVCDNNEE